jgi:hypothetical protein
MISRIIQLLFGCSHKRITLPITPKGKSGVPAGQPYVVCLDCGGQFAYDWKEMRMGERINSPESTAEAETKTWLSRRLRRSEETAGPGRKR